MLFGCRSNVGVTMKNITKSNIIRSVVALTLAFSVAQASLLGYDESVTENAHPAAAAVDVVETDQIVGGQALNIKVYVCLGLLAATPFFPLAIIPAIPVCFSVITGTLG